MPAGWLQAGACALALAAAQAVAAADPLQISSEAGLGAESQSSPLFQVSPVGTPVYLNGLQRYRSHYAQAGAQLMWDGSLPAGLHGTVSASAMLKRAPSQSDFDFSMVSVQPSVHGSLAGLNLGLGPTWLRMGVAHQFSRLAMGWQGSATWVREDDLVSLVADRARQQHSAEWNDLDATASTAVLQWQRKQPVAALAALEALQLSIFLGREVSRQGLDDLSHRSRAFQLGLDWKGWGVDWSVLGTWQRSHFDASAFDGEPTRRDRGWSVDATAQWPLANDLTLQLAAGHGRLHSTTRLYDHRQGHGALTLQRKW